MRGERSVQRCSYFTVVSAALCVAAAALGEFKMCWPWCPDDPPYSSKPADPTRIKGKKRPFSAVVALSLEEAKSVVPLNEVPR